MAKVLKSFLTSVKLVPEVIVTGSILSSVRRHSHSGDLGRRRRRMRRDYDDGRRRRLRHPTSEAAFSR